MRITIGLALASGSLAGCSGGALDIGDSDGGDDRSAAPVAEVSVFSKAAVEKASELCTVIRNNSAPILDTLNSRFSSYTQAQLRSDLVGGWLECYGNGAPEDLTSFQFTADGHWYTLVDDGNGGLTRGRWIGYARPPIGWDGTYTFRDNPTDASAPDGLVVYVATAGVAWFHPEFASRVMSMTWFIEPTPTLGYVLIDP